MSDHEDDLEVQALQRELDDAFATTRPRPGFEDELWLRMQAGRPAASRLRDAIAGFVAGVRDVPAVPMAAVATVLVLALGVGLIAYTGLGRGGGGASDSAAPALRSAAGGAQQNAAAPAAFGRLPSPALGRQQPVPSVSAGSAEYTGPANLVWTGRLNLGITVAPVYRYQEPSANAADQFAASLGAALVERPAGYLGAYAAATYTLNVRGTVAAPAASPAYFILASAAMPPVDAAGAGPRDLADVFLAQHSLAPQWPYSVAVDSGGGLTRVTYQRQLDVPGYGPAHLVDASGARYGIEVDLVASRPVRVVGLLPVGLESAPYAIATDQAIDRALASPAPSAGEAVAPPTVELTAAELVYVLVPAGDHSFYEPAYLLSGSFKLNGVTATRHVLIPAVDPSQRTP